MTTTTSEPVSTGAGQVERKPLMTGSALLMMNLGFFGVQFSFGLTQSAVNPLFLLIGAEPDQLPILNLAGPVTGLIIQPLIGAISDRTWHPRWGRRRPFITAGAILCAIILFVFPFVGILWLAVICFWLLDAGNNTSMEPYRAFISDRLPKSQLARGFLTQSMFTGAGAVLANLSLFLLQKVSALEKTAGNGVPYWMYVCFMIGTVCILLTVLTAMARTKELTPSDEELEEMRAAPKGLAPRGPGDRGRRQGDAGRHAQDRRGLRLPVVRDVHLLAVPGGQPRRDGVQRHARRRAGRPGTTRSRGAVWRTPPTTSSPWSPRCSWWGSPGGSAPSGCTRSPSAWPRWR